MEIDIYNIPIARLTESYLEYINNNDEFSLENAEEYIVMAATLLHIKSKNLLPKFEDENIGDEEDLVQQLLDYKNYKELSEKLDNLQRMRAQFLDKESANIE
ncbi:MAG: segregation/condensation protein A, partial [Gemella haemolysans]|nr:segregation/condensation protein A [Gemella haemolysans]